MLEFAILIHALLEPVVRNSSAEVMDVMDSDAGGDPLERLGEHQVRTALEGSIEVRPVGMLMPIRIFELVLYVEEPHTDGRTDHEHWQVNQEGRLEANRLAQQHHDHQEHRIRLPNAGPFPLPLLRDIPGKAVFQGKHE